MPQLRTGHWLKGDWHVHSRHSTDTSHNPVGAIIAFAEEIGFDYLAITDHDNHVLGAVADNTWADPDHRSETVQLLYGAELTAPRGHINILSATPYDHQRVFDARDARDWDLLAVKREPGVHFSANHPTTKNHYGYSFDLADSIEIWNKSTWEKNIPAQRIWDDMLLSGRMLGARGGSDAHHGLPPELDFTRPQTLEATANYVGTPTTWLFASERSPAAILEALERCRASVSANPNNPRVELWADTDGDGMMDMMMGDNVQPTGQPIQFEVRLIGGAVPRAPYKVNIIKNRSDFACLPIDRDTQVLRFIDTPLAGERTYYRVEIEGPQSPFPQVPNCTTQSGAMVAISNPLYFNYNPDF
ncbi:CehA/McbA family metallohydrolase [Pelagibacterium flavum]|uniref:CehA/McbA family metallohydrolase n=1 Tax=Pelagibacterium flavum TaxID=2984530 RepID=A0ABY6IL40_9HYPH|nr:CehA/McbA family metallohydrolase [Pelagibacterium sp. YIM 151497]UYQ71288.1 CehA/McbA family metallohydrolase [Pelagibacterium sp. YIM 151497]